MESKTPRIRPIDSSDRKLALFIVGKANFESLAVANRQAYSHPLILGTWLLLSLAFIHVMNWWPSSHRGLLGIFGYLKPLPAFASVAVPLMFLIDWNNRPHFEERTQNAIKEKDMHNPVAYYNQSPASGFWILEYGDKFIGLVALDVNDGKRTHKGIIRHFYVEEAFRNTGIQEDLLNHALTHAFDKSSALDSIEATDAPRLIPYLHECYEKSGFKLGRGSQSVGIFGYWKYCTTALQRKDWKRPSS
ncbi:hypothetical protein AN958_04983 [Leucoagaricus sp. SymC.cos]|nr:hypothetical protein AN958_04983 [Leucoagaricus sp. SymC.cos]